MEQVIKASETSKSCCPYFNVRSPLVIVSFILQLRQNLRTAALAIYGVIRVSPPPPPPPSPTSPTLSTTGGNATRVLNDYIQEDLFKSLFFIDSPFKTDLLDHYNCSHWVSYLCLCTITTKVSAVNSHNVIRNYKVNKVSGKYNHEGHESTFII